MFFISPPTPSPPCTPPQMKIYNMYETIMAEYWKFLKQPKNGKFSLRVSHNNLFHLSPSEDALGRRLGGTEWGGGAGGGGVGCSM